MKPSDFIKFPYSSVLQKSEAEQVALNIMIILKRTGDKFRSLSWKEYKKERLKDGEFSDVEQPYFKQTGKWCKSSRTAQLFSPAWDKTLDKY